MHYWLLVFVTTCSLKLFSTLLRRAWVKCSSLAFFGWYANVGFHIIKAETEGVAIDPFTGVPIRDPITGEFTSVSGSDNEILFGGGITGPLSFGEFFAGVDFLDGALLVAGVRFNL